MDYQREKLKKIFNQTQVLTVVGGNWGDEGKGKVIDLVMSEFDVIVRFSGGANAGHTVFTPDGKKLVSHLIPCGLAARKICVLGRGEFFNLELFLKELEDSRAVLQEDLAPVYVDFGSPLWTPYHALFESYIEGRRQGKIGTTSKGIGPLEGLYRLRLSPVVGMLFEPKILRRNLGILYDVLKPCLETMNEAVPTPDEIVSSLVARAEEIKSKVIDTGYFLQEQLQAGKKLMMEGAQATGLDAYWGTYPFVSSGNSAAGGAAVGTGLPPSVFDTAILVAKTLPTRVGNGPQPSEMWERLAAMEFPKAHPELFVKGKERDEFLSSMLAKINQGKADNVEMSQYFQVLGDERGATTGRGRSVGFLDIPWLQYAVRINRPKWLALTRFDMLSGIKTVPVVMQYKFQGEILPPGKLPPAWQLAEVETIKENWEGFEENIGGISEESKLPKIARDFISRLEKLVGVPILLVGTGPGRGDMVIRQV